MLSVAHAAIERLARRSAAYPAEMYWLAWLDDEDYLEFCEEFMQTVRDLRAGHAAPSALDDMAHAWEQSAFAMRDPHLTRRFSPGTWFGAGPHPVGSAALQKTLVKRKKRR